MPYKDKDKRRTYSREYKRFRKAGGLTPGQTLLPVPFKLKTAQDILALLAEQVEAVKNTSPEEAGTLEKARCIGYLAGISLKAVETAGLEARIDALEQRINQKERRIS
ncbi:MAG TPA: hypothetical protein DCK87_02620 [Desulfotomaculum sp.]|nr:hypothetical protein [Desulfotomaculum sp.]